MIIDVEAKIEPKEFDIRVLDALNTLLYPKTFLKLQALDVLRFLYEGSKVGKDLKHF